MRQDIPLRQMLSLRAASTKTPITGGFELTSRCNLKCKMCYIHQDGCRQAEKERSGEEWLEMGRQAAENGALFLLLTGGEPFLRRDFRDIYLGMTKLGLSVSINTNGTLIDAETIEWLSQSPPAQVNISLYGTSRETYGALCGVPAAFDRVKSAIDGLLQAGIQVGINATMSPLNDGDMESIAAFAQERGLRVRPAYYLFPPVRRPEPCSRGLERFPPEVAGRRTAQAQWLTESHETLRRFAATQPEDELFVPTEDCVRVEGAPLGCLAGTAQFWISWDGKMMPCGMMKEPCAFPFEEGFSRAWQTVVEKTASLRLPAVCSGCAMKRACPVCAAINCAESGTTSRRGEYVCRLTAEYIRTLKTLLEHAHDS